MIKSSSFTRSMGHELPNLVLAAPFLLYDRQLGLFSLFFMHSDLNFQVVLSWMNLYQTLALSLSLQEGYLVYECNYSCGCSRSCQNRVLQNGVQIKLEVFKTEKKVSLFSSLFFFCVCGYNESCIDVVSCCSQGWAVRAREAIPRGTFVCEYVGEVIDEKEANKRQNRFGIMSEGCFRLLVIVQSSYLFYSLFSSTICVFQVWRRKLGIFL